MEDQSLSMLLETIKAKDDLIRKLNKELIMVKHANHLFRMHIAMSDLSPEDIEEEKLVRKFEREREDKP